MPALETDLGRGPSMGTPLAGLSKKRLAVAFVIAAMSDVLSVWVELIPPVQMGIDLITVCLLFFVLGWRWILLPALVAEAIPGLSIFPVWTLVVSSLAVGKLRQR